MFSPEIDFWSVLLALICVERKGVVIIIMANLPSRKKYQNCFSKNHIPPRLREKYRGYRYQLCISLDVEGCLPVYTTVKVSTYQNKDDEIPDKEIVILNQHLPSATKAEIINDMAKEELCYTDMKHLGELLFILAAKLKLDLLEGYDKDYCGFLHTEEIKNMNPGGLKAGERRIHVGKSVYGTLRKLYNAAKGVASTNLEIQEFIEAFLSEPEQLYHMVCYLGLTKPDGELLFWWLNTSPDDISFKYSGKDKAIPQVKLKGVLEAFFDGCLLNEKMRSMMVTGAEADITKVNRARETALISEQKRATLLTSQSVRLKYLKDIKEILKFNGSDKSKWFRKTGPIAIDFAEEKVCPRQEAFKQIRKLVFKNKISILEGNVGSGKSVLVRQFAYDLITKENKSQIYHYSFKLNLPISDFREFQDEINSVSGLVIIEDIHLATPHMQCLVDELVKESSGHILLTTRPSFRNNMLEQRSDALKTLPKLSLGQHKDDTDKIIEYYIERNSGKDFQWTQKIKDYIKEVSKGNLWLLSYALRGCEGNSEPLSWIGKEVSKDLECLERLKCKPQILVALSALYMNESMMAHSYLAGNLGFANEDINRLVELGEITKCRVSGDTFYGLPHSSLALAYWEYGSSYRNMLKFSEHTDFVYNYAISGVSNALSAILNMGKENSIALLSFAAIHGRLMDIAERELSCNEYLVLMLRILTSNLMIILPKSVFYSLGSLFVERKCFFTLNLILDSREINIVNLKKFWRSINKERLIGGLYGEGDFGIACSCLGKICKASKKCKSEIYEMIDYEKLLSRVKDFDNRNELTQICEDLSEIGESVALKFWKQLEAKEIPTRARDSYDPSEAIRAFESLSDVDKNALFEFWKEPTNGNLISMIEKSDDLREKGDILINFNSMGPPRSLLYLGNDLNFDESVISELWKQSDYENLLLKMKDSYDLDIIIRTLKERSKIHENITFEYWDELNKDDLAAILQEQKAYVIKSTISTIFKANKRIGQEFWEKHLDIPRIAAKFCNAKYFWQIFCFAQSLKDEYPECAKEFCDEFVDSASMLEKLLKQKKDSFEIIAFVATLCQMGSKTGDKLHHLIGENIEGYAKISMRGKCMWDLFDDVIADVDLIAAKMLYKYYCENIGIEQYIEKVRESNSKERVNKCFVFLSNVDPDNKKDWKKYIVKESAIVKYMKIYLKLFLPYYISLRRWKLKILFNIRLIWWQINEK